MSSHTPTLEDVFLFALDDGARTRFEDIGALAALLARLRESALVGYPDVDVDAATFAAELARRLAANAMPEVLARIHAAHVHLAIACIAGDPRAIRHLEAEFLQEVDLSARRLRARTDQADEVRGLLRRILFTREPGREAALHEFSGRGDLRSYIRVIATRELVRVINRGRREINIGDDKLLDIMSSASDAEANYLRERYGSEVDAALRIAVAAISDESRALLRYSVIEGWSIDRLGALYGIHRSTAARRVAAARDELGSAIRAALSERLGIPAPETDSIIRMVQSRIDVSIERLLA